MSRPPVTIGLPVYNGEKFLRQALDSLLGQTMGDFELIICDNASSDATGQICRAYARADRRVRYYRNATNIGAPRNLAVASTDLQPSRSRTRNISSGRPPTIFGARSSSSWRSR